MRTLLKNYRSQCCSDRRYHNLAFDVVNNELLTGCDTRVVMRRGFEHMNGQCSKTLMQMDDTLSTDSVDNRETVKKLASMLREKQAPYFYAHTFNMSDHFGLKKLSKWIRKRKHQIMSDVNVLHAVRREKVQAFIQSASVVLLRTCMEVGQIFMDYVVNSLERPLGKVIKFWWRFEFQDTKGNLPHIHSLL